MFTSSKGLNAYFNQETGEMTRLEQWDDFHYQQGDRQATADSAQLDYGKDLLTLSTKAHVWDNTGSTMADRIEMRQSTGDTVATGHVTSTRLPDKGTTNSPGMIATGEPLRARADKMVVTDGNTRIRYEGSADLWSGANRLRAPLVEIDRGGGTLRAEGGVTSRLVDNSQQDRTPPASQDAKTQKPAPPAKAAPFTVIRSKTLTYSDTERMAVYQGDAVMDRDDLEVKAAEIRAWFRDNSSKKPAPAPQPAQQQQNQQQEQSSLERIFAEGNVQIVKRSPERTRTASSEIAEYYLDDERLVLKGGNPVVTDSERGSTRGDLVIWYARNDRLLVDNSGSGPAVSRIRERKR